MKRLMATTLLTALFMTSAHAQSLEDGFVEVGRFETEIGGEEVTFLALSDPESGDSYLTAQNTAGYLSMNLAGQEALADGALGQRVISILIGPYSRDIPNEATMEIYAPDGILAANVDTGLVVTLANLTQDGETLRFNFEGKLIPAKNVDGMMVPVDGGAPMEVTGSYSGLFPKAD